MEQVVKVAKIGKSADSDDPNDFIFHSSYNTFKIIKEGTKTVTLSASTTNQSFTEAHDQSFIPLISAFAKRSDLSEVRLPNGYLSVYTRFNYIASNSTNIIFNFDNTGTEAEEVSIRYFVLERVN